MGCGASTKCFHESSNKPRSLKSDGNGIGGFNPVGIEEKAIPKSNKGKNSPVHNPKGDVVKLSDAEDNLERFIREGIVFGNRVDAVKKFLQNTGAMHSFMTFLKSEARNKDIFKEIERTITDGKDVQQAAQNLVQKYSFPPTSPKLLNSNISTATVILDKEFDVELNKEIEDKEKLRTNIVSLLSKASAVSKKGTMHASDKIKREIIDAYEDAQREVMFMIAVDAIPRYIESKFYKEWREEEVENNYAGTQLILELEVRHGLEYSYKDFDKDLESSRLDPNRNETTNYIRRAFAALDPLEVPSIAKSCFLSTFLGSVEGLPISVSLSTASMSRPGFPLIYVNAIFEETTGYTRKEIIGQNCKFLQAGNAEPESIAMLTIALKEAKPVKTEITNYRKNGEPFRNLLAMKPIFDHQGKYVYVVGLQFDVSSESASLQKLEFIDHLLSMLPDKLPYDDFNKTD